MLKLLGIAACAFLCQPAQAAWHEATTAHFVIDADSSESRLRDFAIRLERFDAALRTIYSVPDDTTRQFNRVTIIATDQATIARLGRNSKVRGFYLPRADRSVIFTATLAGAPKKTAPTGSSIPSVVSFDLDAQAVLLHEYTHHFMFTNFPRAYPLWFSEGFAELNGNAQFDPDGTLTIGTVPLYRAGGLAWREMAISDLMEPSTKLLNDPARLDTLYGRGWLLTHYLMIEGGRSADLTKYLNALNAGRSSMDAAREAFGDLGELSKQMNGLITARSMRVMVIKSGKTPSVTITTLSPAASALMPAHMQSLAGVDKARAPALAAAVERLGAEYTRDPTAQDAVAEAEFDADRYDQADAAADHALAAAPQDIQALLYKGRIAVQRLVRAGSGDAAAWKAARAWYVRANHLAPDAAMPLLLYYAGYRAEGPKVPEVAFHGLLRARQLAPQDVGVGLLVAEYLLNNDQADAARGVLQPLAYQPHGGAIALDARYVIDALDAAKPELARSALAADVAKILAGI